MLSLLSAWTKFFHARLHTDGCHLCGLIRIAFAALVIVDKLVLTLDLDYFMSPSNGVIPRRIFAQDPEYSEMLTLFDLLPESDKFLWAMHWIGLLHAVLLLVGVAPRVNLLGLFVNMVSFHHHNDLIWDAEDTMFRIWCFLLLFSPLHRCTIYELFRKRNWENDSWPMWPIRLFQLEVTFLYVSVSLSKLPGGAWIDGTALYYIIHMSSFYPGICNPEVLFHRYLPLKLMTWGAILTELICWITVWIPSLRTATVIHMIIFHIGIDVTMSMHCFEWLAILGWIVHLLQPDVKNDSPSQQKHTLQANDKKHASQERTIMSSLSLSFTRMLVNAFIAAILTAFAIDTLPLWHIKEQAPVALKPKIQALDTNLNKMMEDYHISTILNLAGLEQGPWTLFDGDPIVTNVSYEAVITFEDGTRDVWKTRNWYEVGNFERKRYTRPLNYYESLHNSSRAVWSSLCLYLSRQHSSKEYNNNKQVDICELIYHREVLTDPPPPPANYLGWFSFEPVKQHKMTVKRPEPLVVLRRGCMDYDPLCSQWAATAAAEEEDGDGCEDEWMEDNCQRSCDLCMDGYHSVSIEYDAEGGDDDDYHDHDEGDEEDIKEINVTVDMDSTRAEEL